MFENIKKWVRGNKQVARQPHSFRPTLEGLEERSLLSANSYDVYALALINEMRADPATFGQELRRLYQGGNFMARDGMSASDPVWTDLRRDIGDSDRTGPWHSGFDGRGGETFLSVISNLPRERPLALVDSLQNGAENHTQWMIQNGYAHTDWRRSGSGAPQAIPGLVSQPNPNATPDAWLPVNSGQAEDISFGYGPGSNTYATFHNNLQEYYKRVAYADTIGFMLENHNGSPAEPWGHLFNLASYDPIVGATHGLALSATPKNKELQVLNAIGIDIHNYHNSTVNPNSNLDESSLTTHRFAYYQGHSYICGVLYADNGNGFYSPGEGVNGQVSYHYQINYPTGLSETGDTIAFLRNGTGYFEFDTPAGPGTRVTVSVNYNGRVLPSQTVTMDAGNAWLSFNVNRGFGLVDSGPGISLPGGNVKAAVIGPGGATYDLEQSGQVYRLDGTSRTLLATNVQSISATNTVLNITFNGSGDTLTEALDSAGQLTHLAYTGANGVKTLEMALSNGVITLWTTWNTAGQKLTDYYQSGSRFVYDELHNGLLAVEYQYESGKVVAQKSWSNGICTSFTTWNTAGQKLSEYYQSGSRFIYHELHNGVVALEYQYESGRVVVQAAYANGVCTMYYVWNTAGQQVIKIWQSGSQYFYETYRNGVRVAQDVYENGRKVAEYAWDMAGHYLGDALSSGGQIARNWLSSIGIST
jgi:hypothetical protein